MKTRHTLVVAIGACLLLVACDKQVSSKTTDKQSGDKAMAQDSKSPVTEPAKMPVRINAHLPFVAVAELTFTSESSLQPGRLDPLAMDYPPVHPLGTFKSLKLYGKDVPLTSKELKEGLLTTSGFGEIEVFVHFVHEGFVLEYRAFPADIEKLKKAYPVTLSATQMENLTGDAVKSMLLNLRATPIEHLTGDAVKSMLQRYNFYCGEPYDRNKEYYNPRGTGIQNKFEKQSKNGGEVVIDHASELMWQQSGSKESMPYEEAKEYIQKINTEKFTGYSDWRLPTLEEAMSLMKPTKNKDDLCIDPLFDKKQPVIWSSDTYSAESAWVVNFLYGYCVNSLDSNSYGFSYSNYYVRAVR